MFQDMDDIAGFHAAYQGCRIILGSIHRRFSCFCHALRKGILLAAPRAGMALPCRVDQAFSFLGCHLHPAMQKTSSNRKEKIRMIRFMGFFLACIRSSCGPTIRLFSHHSFFPHRLPQSEGKYSTPWASRNRKQAASQFRPLPPS